MLRICKKYGNQLNVKDGKLHIESENDIDLTLKMLADYYKKEKFPEKHMGHMLEKK